MGARSAWRPLHSFRPDFRLTFRDLGARGWRGTAEPAAVHAAPSERGPFALEAMQRGGKRATVADPVSVPHPGAGDLPTENVGSWFQIHRHCAVQRQ